jgi:hypothetical protein
MDQIQKIWYDEIFFFSVIFFTQGVRSTHILAQHILRIVTPCVYTHICYSSPRLANQPRTPWIVRAFDPRPCVPHRPMCPRTPHQPVCPRAPRFHPASTDAPTPRWPTPDPACSRAQPTVTVVVSHFMFWVSHFDIALSYFANMLSHFATLLSHFVIVLSHFVTVLSHFFIFRQPFCDFCQSFYHSSKSFYYSGQSICDFREPFLGFAQSF